MAVTESPADTCLGARAACLSYRLYLLETSKPAIGVDNLIVQARIKDRQRLAKLLEAGLVGAASSAYASCVAALYLAAREPSNIAGEAALPDAVRERLSRQGMSLAVSVLGACVGFGSIAPYLLEVLLHECPWPFGGGGPKRPWSQVRGLHELMSVRVASRREGGDDVL